MTQTVTAAVAKRDKADQLVTWLRRQQDDIAMAAASHVKPSAIIRVTQGALRRNDKLAMAAIANPQSLLYALLDCARLGHEPDTDEYYLVPFGNEVTGIEGYKGIIERMYRARGVTSVVAQVVRKSDRYVPRGENTPPLHEYDPFAAEQDRGPLRGAYAYAIFPGGHCSQVISMGRAEIMEHKKVSRGSDRADSPWQVWEPAMWKKTVLRALEPYVPTSTEYRAAGNMAPAAAEPAVFHRIEHDGVSSSAEIFEAEIVDDPPPSNGAAKQEPPKTSPRKARGKAAAGNGAPAPDPAGTGQSLPPPPCEEDHGTFVVEVPAAGRENPPGRATSGQLSMLGQRLGKLGVDDENRLGTLERLAGHELAEPSELTQDEAAHIRGLLDRCTDSKGNPDRGALVELLATGQLPDAEKAGEVDG